MSEIVELLILNDLLSLKEVGKLLSLDFNVSKVAKEYLSMHIDRYHTGSAFGGPRSVEASPSKRPTLCRVCLSSKTLRVNPFTRTALCKRCTYTQMVNKTAAKREYKLSDTDLYNIPCYCYPISQWQLGYMYEKKTVEYISVIKMIKRDWDAILNPPRRKIRENKILKIVDDLGIYSEFSKYKLANYILISRFLSGGLHGIRIMRTLLAKWTQFFKILETSDKLRGAVSTKNVFKYFDLFIAGKDVLLKTVEKEYEMLKEVQAKERKILDSLKKTYGLYNKDKCYSLHQLLFEVPNDLEVTVQDVEEYQFFVKYTNFLYIRNRTLRRILRTSYKDKELLIDSLRDINWKSKVAALTDMRDYYRVPSYLKIKYLFKPHEY